MLKHTVSIVKDIDTQHSASIVTCRPMEPAGWDIGRYTGASTLALDLFLGCRYAMETS
jgi:hypothetical protein